ncbi:hypothetical protein SEUCBS140593_006016 [Sporothrix eucalyptigena]|uniref:beta-glucosidase n=1 Tax=Sporothrix eucalyptigena TaxID=1812306 RepID=A0ABP0C192_9PEZI
MPGPPARRTLQTVQKLVDSGGVDVKEIDARVLTLLKLLRRTGKFTDRKESVPERAIRRPEHDRLIREAGSEGIVLLKNAGEILPLRKELVKKIAILGPLAKHASAHGGGSASLNSHYTINPFDALTERLDGAELTYSQGAHIFRAYPSLAAGLSTRDNKSGFLGEFFKTLDMSDEPFHTESYSAGMFMNVMKTEVTGAKAGRFTASFIPEKSGNHYLSFAGGGATKFFINGELIGETGPAKDIAAFFFGCEEGHKVRHDFKAGETYDIVLDTIISPVANSDLSLFEDQVCGYIGFVSEQEMDANLLSEAVELAKRADVAICFVGNTSQWETEGVDKASMTLPAHGSQDKLVAAVSQVNPNTIVVLTTGSAVELPWLDQASAVLQAFYAGQETGNSIVDVLLGEVNPGGRLPFSWPRKYEHTGCYGNFGLDSFESRKIEYVEGVNVGYRHFDALYGTDREVMFPFGYGLSYTSFDVGGTELSGSLSGDDANAEVSVTVAVRNTGAMAGSQVIQVYLAPPQGGTNGRPAKSLAAFGKLHLAPREQRDLHLSFKRDAAAFWAKDGIWRVESGEHKVLVSTSSNPADVKAELSLNVASGFNFEA